MNHLNIEDKVMFIHVTAQENETVNVIMPRFSDKEYHIESCGLGKVVILVDPTEELKELLSKKTFWQKFKDLFS